MRLEFSFIKVAANLNDFITNITPIKRKFRSHCQLPLKKFPNEFLKKKVADGETCCARCIGDVAGSCTEQILRAECRKETQRNLNDISENVPAPHRKKRAVQREASCFMELSLEALTLHLPYLLTGGDMQ